MENLTSKSDQFLSRIYKSIEENLDKEHYSVEDLAVSVGLSRSMLHRKLKKLTGKSAGDLITEKRLEKACELLRNDVATISEIAYLVGFNSPSYFNKVFKKHFKVSPGDFKKEPESYIQLVPKTRVRKALIPKKLKKYVWIVLLAGNIILIYIIINASKSVPFEERDWIVITDFENQTEETIFDKSLNTAFSLSISQSRYVNVISRTRMLEALKRMKKGNIRIVDEETGREIALREGINLYIVPGISKIGSKYILTGRILDAQSSEILKSEVIYVKSKDDIIKELDQLSRRTRRNLGESSYMISKQGKPLSKVTTSSLDALKEFSLGVENHISMRFDEALIHYENAIKIDSNFISAKASLGNLLYEKFDRERGIQMLQEVIESIENLTIREKYSILSTYAAKIENDLDKAVEYTTTLLELYPDDPKAYNNIGWYYQRKGEYEKAVEAYKAAIKINPYTMISYGGLIWTYLEFLAEFDSVKTWSRQLIDRGPENPWGYFYLGSAYAAQDSLEKAEASLIKARDLDPDLFLNSYRLAHVYCSLKNYKKAIDILEKIANKGESEIIAHYFLGINYDLSGEKEKARDHFNKYLETAEKWVEMYPDYPQTYIMNGLALTQLGKKDLGWRIGQKALEFDSTAAGYFDFARLLAAQGREGEAFKYLEMAFDAGYRDLMWLKLDPDLFSLHDDKRFTKLISKYF